MPDFDLSTLPAPLDRYFSLTDHAEAAPLFAPQAEVRDEGEWHRGRAAIAHWLERVEDRYHPRYTVQAVETAKDRTIVTFEVSGTFPGSPATLRQAFAIDQDELITHLETL